jgi:hypothetical protein
VNRKKLALHLRRAAREILRLAMVCQEGIAQVAQASAGVYIFSATQG